MAVTTYYGVGSIVNLVVAFTTSAGTPVDPSGTKTFTLTQPSGTITTYVHGTDAELVKDSTGVYYVSWTVAAAGPYEWEIVGAGTNGGVDGGKFRGF